MLIDALETLIDESVMLFSEFQFLKDLNLFGFEFIKAVAENWNSATLEM